MTRAAAVALLAAAGTAGCCGSPSAFTVLNGPARAPGPPPPLAPPAVRALHFGDFGDRTARQAAVARGIELSHWRSPFDLAFAAGDLVYDCGPDPSLPGAEACAFEADGSTVAPGFVPPSDPSFEVHDRPLSFLGAVPVHPALGNHDVAAAGRCRGPGDPVAISRRKACLAVARSGPQWVMPGRHYAVDAGPARFIVIDSNAVVADYGGFSLEEEIAFVAAQAEGCRDRTCFLVGHHPPATAGTHRDGALHYRDRMERLLAAASGRIRAYLAGHDHDLQHLRTASGLDVFVSGAAARGRTRERFESTTPPGARLLFGSVRAGHAVLEVSGDGWRYRFEDERASPLYCCTAVGTGPCEPTACP